MLSLADIGPQTLIASKRLVSSACMLCVVFSLLIRRGHLMQSSDPRVRTDLSGATAGKRAARDAAEAPSSEHKDAGCAGGETQREGERERARESVRDAPLTSGLDVLGLRGRVTCRGGRRAARPAGTDKHIDTGHW